jgi:UDP-3-O-[3-hydroxymyristoyl] glucosamine N-acyltransferase
MGARDLMKLSEYITGKRLTVDGDFQFLGQCGSAKPQTLAYCDTIFHLQTALANPNISCVIIPKDLEKSVTKKIGLLLTDQPRVEFYKLHNQLAAKNLLQPEMKYGRGSNCTIHPTAIVSEKSYLGNNVRIGPGAIIRENVWLDDDVFVDAGAIIGCDGILYFEENGDKFHIQHAGSVKIGKHTAILSGAVIAKSISSSDVTEIGRNCIIGIASNIGHEAKIGNNCVISGNCVVARLASIKDNCWIGTTSVIREHVVIGEGAKVGAGSIVIENVDTSGHVSGNFAYNHAQNLKDFLKRKRP